MKLYGVSTQQGPIFIVQELMINGEFPPSLPPSLPPLASTPPFILHRLSTTVLETEEGTSGEVRNHSGHGMPDWICHVLSGEEWIHPSGLGEARKWIGTEGHEREVEGGVQSLHLVLHP